MCFSNQPPSFVYLQNCLRLCSCLRRQSIQTDDGDDENVGCVVVESLSAWPRRPPASSPPPPSAPIPLLLTMLHIINQLWVGLPCKYPNESSFIKWLNGPDKSPNEEINNSVIVTLLILIRPSCSALIPAKRKSFFTVFSSACQHCCRFLFFLFCPWSLVMNCALLSVVSWKDEKAIVIWRCFKAQTLLPMMHFWWFAAAVDTSCRFDFCILINYSANFSAFILSLFEGAVHRCPVSLALRPAYLLA